jgi:hypothetical protein
MEVTLEFVDNVQRAIQDWRYINALKAIGLAEEAAGAHDVQAIMMAVHNNIVKNSEKIIAPQGVPTRGTVTAPVEWLNRMTDVDVGASANPQRFARLEADGVPMPKDDFIRDVSENGVKEPVTVYVNKDTGLASLHDGNHRVAAAYEVDPHMEIPVKYVLTEGDAFPEAGMFNHNLKNVLLDPDNLPGVGHEFDAADLFKVYPWDPKAVNRTVRKLRGTSTMHNTIPLGVMNDLTKAGMPYGDDSVRGLRELYRFERESTIDSFLASRRYPTEGKNEEVWDVIEHLLPKKGTPNTWERWGDTGRGGWLYYDDSGKPIMHMSITSAADTPIDISWAAARDASQRQSRRGARAAMAVLDVDFATGTLQGKLTNENVL